MTLIGPLRFSSRFSSQFAEVVWQQAKPWTRASGSHVGGRVRAGLA